MTFAMRQVPLERDINIAVNGCSGFATSTQKGPFMAMLISRSRGTYLICGQLSKFYRRIVQVLSKFCPSFGLCPIFLSIGQNFEA